MRFSLCKCGIHPRNICETARIDVAVARHTIVLKAEASLSQAEWQAASRAHLYEVRAAVRERARSKVFRSARGAA